MAAEKDAKKKDVTNVAEDAKKAAKPATKRGRRKKGAKRGPKPASERTVDFVVQFGGKETSYGDIVGQIKEMWKSRGKRETSLKALNIYVKPEESTAYYVINAGTKGEETGEIKY